MAKFRNFVQHGEGVAAKAVQWRPFRDTSSPGRSFASAAASSGLVLASDLAAPPYRAIDADRWGRFHLISRRIPLVLLGVVLCFIAAVWWWAATPVNLARAPIDPQAKLECVSYAPFRAGQTPLDESTRVSAAQIADDMK